MLRMSTSAPERLGAMSAGSRLLARRMTPELWARNLHDQLELRRRAGGGRLTRRGTKGR